MDYKLIPYIGTGIFLLLVGIFALYFFMGNIKKKKEEMEFNRKLKNSTDPGFREEEKEGPLTKIVKNMPVLLIQADVFKASTPHSLIQKRIWMLVALAFMVGLIVGKNAFIGLIVALLFYVGVFAFATFKINKKKRVIDNQIQGFIELFKSNVQANQHVQNAMVNAIENTAVPLYNELEVAKAVIESGDFRAGIASIRINAENETLKQLASCIELAASSGSNITEQIEIIEGIIKDKQEMAREKQLGINQNKPLFIVAALIVPFSFIGSYLMSEMHRTYWFTTPISYAILAGVIFMSLLSTFFTWKIIKKIDIG